MKYFIIFIVGISASCGSIETRKTIFFLHPRPIRLGGSLFHISMELGIDTIGYRTISQVGHIKGKYVRYTMKEFTLSRKELERLNLKDNLFDSVYLTFYKDFLYSASFYLSHNQKIEILKFGLNARNRELSGDVSFRGDKLYAKDTSFYSAGYRGLSYSYTKNRIGYSYREDILDNVAVLDIENLKMRRLFK